MGHDHPGLDLAPRTGRTHQLRAHMAHLGHPIAGDRKYGDPELNRALEDAAGLRRLFLHASRLAFPYDPRVRSLLRRVMRLVYGSGLARKLGKPRP